MASDSELRRPINRARVYVSGFLPRPLAQALCLARFQVLICQIQVFRARCHMNLIFPKASGLLTLISKK